VAKGLPSPVLANQPAGRRAVFFDRDGTLIVDHGYLSSASQVEFVPDAVAVLQTLREHGFLLVVVSNQSGIGRGILTDDEAAAVDQRFQELLASSNISLDGIYYCPHAPEAGCDCRKPKPGLLRCAAEDLGIILAESYMVGDKISDCEAGRRAGCRPVRLGDAPWSCNCTHISNLRELPELILRDS
jgi:D-glycero-D-manno-heptose 1,7-bisphosphate phosphatase